MITVSGDTFPHRDLLRAYRGNWNPIARAWEFDDLRSHQIDTLRGLVGISVTGEPAPRQKPAPWSNVDRILSILLDDDTSETLTRDGTTAIYGNDATYLNHFAEQNPTAFFGFSSLGALIDYVEQLNRPPSGRDAGWKTTDPDWSGTPDMPAALRLAREGWHDGLEGAAALDIPHAVARRRRHALAGGAVNVGRLLAGNPEHMVHRPRLPGRRIVTLFVETFMSAGIDPGNAIIRAILIAGIADTLEREGYSCTIVAVLTTHAGWSDKVGHQAAVTLKEAGERLNLLDIVFALGHPSFFRRLLFACVGAAPECRSTWSSQGSPSAAFNTDHPCGRNEFYIKQLSLASQRKLGDDPLDMLPFIEPDGLPITLRSD